jgi:hypothetical protein
LAFWLKTTGVAPLTVKWCSPAHMPVAAHDGGGGNRHQLVSAYSGGCGRSRIKRMNKNQTGGAPTITAAARARLDAAAPPGQGPSADQELQATHRQAAQIMASTAREAAAVLTKAWRARQKA